MSKWLFKYRCSTCGEVYWLKVVNASPMPIVVDASNRDKEDHFCKGEFIKCEPLGEEDK